MTPDSRSGPAAAVLVMGIALLAALAGSAGPSRPAPTPEAAAAPPWAGDVEAARDHVTARELVDRVLRDPESVAVVDVRPAEEFARFHLRGSANLDLPRLLGPEGDALLAANAGKLVVLVSNGMTHPAQAWTELARRGRGDVRILEDGLDGLVATELAPPSLRGPATEAASRLAAPRFLAARRALVGVGETPAVGTYATDPDEISEPTVVSAAWLERNAAGVVVLDARASADAYAAGHVPGARHAPLDRTRGAVGGVAEQVLPPSDLAALFGSLGVGAETPVVVYADEKMHDAAHLAVALLSAGHRRVALLEGGLSGWVASGRPVSVDAPAVAPTTYATRPPVEPFAAAIDDVARASRDGSALILDVRPPKQFRGEESTEARPGRIPGAVNRELATDVVKLDGALRWRPREELAAAFAALGATAERDVIVTCRTGHQAAQTWFLLRFLLGHRRVRWYDGSWKEWAARSDLPAETGPPKG